VASLASLRSESIQGLSVVTAMFGDRSDVLAVRQALAERLATLAGQLPARGGVPTMEPPTSSTMDVLKLGLVSDRLDPPAPRDVASVVEGAAPRFGDALIQGRPGVLLTLSSQYGSNTLEVTRAIERALAELRPVLDQNGVELFARLHRPATFIEHALQNLRSSVLFGAALVVAVLFVFLGRLRTTLI